MNEKFMLDPRDPIKEALKKLPRLKNCLVRRNIRDDGINCPWCGRPFSEEDHEGESSNFLQETNEDDGAKFGADTMEKHPRKLHDGKGVEATLGHYL